MSEYIPSKSIDEESAMSASDTPSTPNAKQTAFTAFMYVSSFVFIVRSSNGLSRSLRGLSSQEAVPIFSVTEANKTFKRAYLVPRKTEGHD